MLDHRSARAVILRALPPDAKPSSFGIHALQSVAARETAYGTTVAPNNWGSVQTRERDPSKAKKVGDAYYKIYGTPEEGARDFIREMWRRAKVRAILSGPPVPASVLAQAMRDDIYFTASVAIYYPPLVALGKEIARAIGEPTFVSEGPVVNTSAIQAYIRQVDVEWRQTRGRMARVMFESHTGGPSLPEGLWNAFQKDHSEWMAFYAENVDDLILADSIYDAARAWHQKVKGYEEQIPTPNPAPTIPVPDPAPDDPIIPDVTGPATTLLGVGALIVAALAIKKFGGK